MIVKLAFAALLAALLAACSSSPGAQPAAPHLSKHTTCGEWAHWPQQYRVLSAGIMADGMGAYDRSQHFHERFARELLTACQGDEHSTIATVAAGLATLDRRDFS